MREAIMKRRHFLAVSAASVAAAGIPAWQRFQPSEFQSWSALPPAYSVIPVVGDGKWIWTEPPKETGYLEPRPHELSIGVELQGEDDATMIRGSTPVPMEWPEQPIDDVRIETEGCEARIQQVGEGAAQLLLAASEIRRGQTIRAIAHYKLTLKKQYLGHQADHFSAQQPESPPAIRKQYLQDSPGIQTSSAEVRKLHRELMSTVGNALRGVPNSSASEPSDPKHPWNLVKLFQAWIAANMTPKRGRYTGVINALRNKVGDCEEMAGIMVALCRASGIPARLVWVPNHNWAEFYLTDKEGHGHWIPGHTSCYAWLGWTGVHELVIQKGDRVTPAQERKPQRLLEDWLQWSGKQPKARYVADLTPLPPSGSADGDPGPGARSKIASGEWKLTGKHSMDRYLRNG
jgi:hypothetical protein